MIRFIHAADIHLDSPMRGIDPEKARIDPSEYRISTRKALANLVDVAIREKVDFLTLGGDNYDGDWDNYETGLFFLEQMARLDQIPVVSISGNHDAANKMTLRLNYPKNFKALSDEQPMTHEIISGVRVVGQGFRDPKESRNLAELYPRLDGAGIKIGLLHTSLDGREGHARYAPCSVDDLLRKHYHFWGLGHIHKHAWENRSGEPPILFPGNLQGRHAKESGPKGAWLITLDDDGQFVEKKFLELDVTRWLNLEISISDMENLDDFYGACEREFLRQNDAAGNRTLAVRLRITGESELHESLLALRENRDDALLHNIQMAATSAAAQRVWVEKMELASRKPQAAHRFTPAAFTFLEEFINHSVMDEAWIENYLKSPEIKKLKQQIEYFPESFDTLEIKTNFEPDSIRQIVQETPEILEMRLGRHPIDQVRDEEK